MMLIRVVLLAVVLAIATFFLGWISVPVLAAVYAALLRASGAPAEAALAALLGWGALLARVAVVPAFSTLLARLGGIFQVPGPLVAVVTVLFAAVLAWSAARVVTGLVVRPVRPGGD